MDADKKLFRRYLLGELEETEQEALERELMSREERFQELLIAEEELVDDFCEGTLSASEVEQYRKHFLTTRERLQQHRFGAALRKYLSLQDVAPSREKPSFLRGLDGAWRPALALVAMAFVAAGLWWILQPFPLVPMTERGEGSTAALFLTTGDLRSAEPETEQSLTVPAGFTSVELQLDVPADASGEQEVEIENARSGRILAKGALPVETLEGQSVVVAVVPSDLLPPGEYRVVLRAASTNGAPTVPRTYEFRIGSP